MDLLIGSTFPLSLIRREVRITPRTPNELRSALAGATIHSFWGHTNTLPAARDFTGIDLSPRTTRPALILSHDLKPTLDEVKFNACWILSPDYEQGFRPRINEEVDSDRISGWQVLHMTWPHTDVPPNEYKGAS